MDILGSFVNVIDTYMIAPIVRRIKILTSSSDNLRELQDKVRDLKAAQSDKQHNLDEAEIAGLVVTDTASKWFKDVREIEVEATVIEEGYHQRTCAGGWCVNCCSLYKFTKRSVELKQRAGDMLDKQFDLARRPLPKSVIEMESEQIENQPSTEYMLQTMLTHLNDPDIGIIGVYGMGGVGKTTLIKQVNNHFISKENSPFNTVIMVTVSANPDIRNIRTSIGKRLGLDLSNDSEDDAREKLLDALRKKNFLLILDDVWRKLELKNIGIPHPRKNHKGNKILITSRIKDTCSQMDAEIKLKVQPMSRDESWNLFVKKAGQHVAADRIKCFAETIVGKCKGLPLAIVTVAHAMADRDEVGEWADAVREMEQSATNLRGMKEEVFVPLKFSFDKLEDDKLRSLFLYCACFPEDCNILKEEILMYCVGEALVDELGSLTAARNKGEALIGNLKTASMLEDGERKGTVKMHDMMRELAVWITSSTFDSSPKFLIRTSESFKEPPHANEWLDSTRMSLMDTQIKELPELGERCPKLTTLLLSGNWSLSTVPPTNFFQHMDHLSILDLSFSSELEYLPDSLSCLVNLRVLRLHKCASLRVLPALGMLRKLQVLDLHHCLMLDQPIIGSECVGGLINLRFLDLSSSKAFIPMGVLSRLLKLEDLRLEDADNIKWKVGVENEKRDGSESDDGSKGQRDEGNIIINEEVSFRRREEVIWLSSVEEEEEKEKIDVGELSQLTHLTSLSISFEGIIISDWFKPLAKKMVYVVKLQDCIVIKQDAIQALNESQNLMHLEFWNCPGLTCVPTRVKYLLQIWYCEDLEKVLDGAKAYQDSFQTLHGLILLALPKLERICVGLAPLNCFGMLERISISNCSRLKTVFTKGMPCQFKNLEVIHVVDCHGMEVIIEAEEEEDDGEIFTEVSTENAGVISPFPKLKELVLMDLPTLADVCSNHHILHCPLLETVVVRNCPRLKKDPLHIRKEDELIVVEDEMTQGGTGRHPAPGFSLSLPSREEFFDRVPSAAVLSSLLSILYFTPPLLKGKITHSPPTFWPKYTCISCIFKKYICTP